MCTRCRNRQKSESSVSFSGLFAVSANKFYSQRQRSYTTVFILQCQDIKNVYQIALKKKAETSVIQIIFYLVFSLTSALTPCSLLRPH